MNSVSCSVCLFLCAFFFFFFFFLVCVCFFNLFFISFLDKDKHALILMDSLFFWILGEA